MSNDQYAGKSPLDIAAEAERNLNAGPAKKGHSLSDSSMLSVSVNCLECLY